MVKFNTICRASQSNQRETKFDIEKVFRNPDPALHPLQKAREYQRALLSAKIDKIYAQPFLGAFTGHSDGISTLATSLQNLQKLVSGSFDGEVKIWDVPSRKSLVSLNAHKLAIKGVCFNPSGMRILTSSDDKTAQLYDFNQIIDKRSDPFQEPLVRFLSKTLLGNIDHHYHENQFATSGQIVQVWNYQRTKPFVQLQWGPDTVMQVKYSPSESNLLAGVTMDRCVVLWDIRAESAIHKVSLLNKSQCLAWNPIEPINLTVGNDDANAYTFDIRKMDQAKVIHKDHIQAIMSVAYCPTGQEFVTGSFDKTIRIFPVSTGTSREVYHTERMSQVNAVSYSQDAQFVFSGSNDMNIRIWKAKASQKLGVINRREENAINYREALQNKFKYNKEIKRIIKHRHIPKYILNAKNRKKDQKISKVRKLKNVEINNKSEFIKPKPERQQRVQNFIE